MVVYQAAVMHLDVRSIRLAKVVITGRSTAFDDGSVLSKFKEV